MLGVALSSLKELSFTTKSLYGALLSNVAFAGRAVLSKATMVKPVGENMTPANLCASSGRGTRSSSSPRARTVVHPLLTVVHPLLTGTASSPSSRSR